MPTAHEKLIGKHPIAPNFIATWLKGEDVVIPTTDLNKKHRKLTEIKGRRTAAIKALAALLIEHHIDNEKILELQIRKDEILKKYKLRSIKPYIEGQHYFPEWHETQKGNFTEILLSHYLQGSSGLELLAYKLTYNGNVDQALKGDDCLLFDKVNLNSKIIVGEAKYRATPNPKAVRDIIDNLQNSKRLPVSLSFMAQYFTTKGDILMSSKLTDLNFEVRTGKVPIINVGLLLSTQSSKLSQDTIKQVDKNLKTSNPNLVFLSLGIDNPKEIIDKAFALAKKNLIKII